MRVKLLKQHFIGGRLYEPDEELDVTVVTPEMEGLDEQARAAIKEENIRVFGRPRRNAEGMIELLDDPPILRPLDENRPVPPVPQQGPPGS